nr:hypothetical protein Iba_chr04bCG3260 [Ipomoea batatas]GME11877.1 hypothetical protein Iba_scaffold12828CG0020 [Ipomoea batatas]
MGVQHHVLRFVILATLSHLCCIRDQNLLLVLQLILPQRSYLAESMMASSQMCGLVE